MVFCDGQDLGDKSETTGSCVPVYNIGGIIGQGLCNTTKKQDNISLQLLTARNTVTDAQAFVTSCLSNASSQITFSSCTNSLHFYCLTIGRLIFFLI